MEGGGGGGQQAQLGYVQQVVLQCLLHGGAIQTDSN